MASSRRTYDTDVITLRKVFAKEPGDNSNVPAMRTLTADGKGGTYWAIPSSLGANPSFNEIVTSAGTYTADLSYNTFRLSAGENIGMYNGSPGSNETYLYAKAYSQVDISGENTLYAFRNNMLDSSLSVAGQNGITLRGDPGTNTLFIVGPGSTPYAISTGIYGFNQVKVTEAVSSITSNAAKWDGTFITATSPSTLLRFAGVNDIQLSTNVTANAVFFTISTFTSKGYLDISANAYSAYPSSLSTVNGLYVKLNDFNSTVYYLSSDTGYVFSSLTSSLTATTLSTGYAIGSLDGKVNSKVSIDQLNSYSNAITGNMYSTTVGLGTLGYISTSLGGVIGTAQLVSTVEGLGTVGYLSTIGGIIGNITTANLNSTVQGLGASGYVSTLSLNSTVQGLGASGYVSTISLTSTVRGLGTSGYVSSVSLISTVAGLGSSGYLSALRGFAISTGTINTCTLTLLDVYTSAVNYLTISSGSLLVNGAKVSGGGGGGGNVAQILAGTNISVTPAGGTGVVTITNTGPTQTTIDNSISSFSTALALPTTVNTYISTFSTALGPLTAISSSNLSTLSSIYGSTFTTANLNVSTMNTVNILPSQSNLWVAVGYKTSVATDTIQTSVDGLTWLTVSSGGFSSAGKSVAYNGSLWVAVGNNGGAAGSIQYSGSGKNWSNNASGGFSSGATGIAYNGRLWIAVGNNGGDALTSIQVSTDGSNWSAITSGGFSVTGEGIAWNGKYWVATGQGATAAASIQTSIDGFNWVSATSGGFSVSGRGVAWNGLYWVAVGDDTTAAASIQTSGDGRNWSNVLTGGFVSAGTKVAWNGKLWVAAGDDNTVPKSLQYSYDGSNWSDANTGGFSGDGYAVAWNGSIWVAGGIALSALASIQTSTDGINWSNITSGGFSNGTIGLAYSSNLTPAYLQQNLAILSQNIPSYIRSTNQILAQPSSLVINNTLLVDEQFNRVGINTTNPQTELDVKGTGRFITLSSFALNVSSINGALPGTGSGNGSSITVSTGSLYASSMSFVNIAQTNTNLWVAVGDGGSTNANIKYSIDGTTWTNSSSGSFTKNAFGVGWNGKLWVAMGENNPNDANTIKYSLDGAIWTNASGGFTSQGFGVAWNGKLWVAVGYGGSASIKYSTDGINWSDGTNTFSTAGKGIAWNGKLWVAVGYGGSANANLKYSADGINWTDSSSGGFTTQGLGIAWNGRLWVAVGDGTNNTTIMYSADGINWTNSSSGGFGFAGNKVAWNGSLWIAVGDDSTQSNTIKYSRDGINWSNSAGTGFTGQGYGIVWNGKLWIVVGTDSTQNVKYSTDGINWTNISGGKIFTNAGYGIAYSSNVVPSYNQTNFEIEPQNIPVFLRSTNQLSFTQSSIIANNTLFVDTTNRVGINVGTPQTDLDVYGIGRFLTLSSLALNLSSINGVNYPTILPSTVAGLGTVGYISSASLQSSIVSTVAGLAGSGIIYGSNLTSTVAGLGTYGYVSTLSLNSTVQGLGTYGYVSTLSLNSTVQGLGAYGYVSTLSLNSTVQGLGAYGYVSTLSLNSTVAGLGTYGYISSLSLRSTIVSTTAGILSNAGFPSTVSTSYALAFNTSSMSMSSINLVNIQQTNTNLWVAVGNDSTQDNTIKYSYDGITWNNSSGTGFSATGHRVAWNGTLWIAVGENNPVDDKTIKYSYDAITWSNSSGAFDSGGDGIAWNGRMWVAVGDDSTQYNTIKYSYDGINWLNSSGPAFNSRGYGIAWNGSLWVAVGSDSTIQNCIQYSYDGITWNTSLGATFVSINGGRSVAWNGRMWIAVGTGVFLYSYDGITWFSTATAFSSIALGIAWNGRMWVAVGSDSIQNNRIKYSYDGINWFNSSGTAFDTAAGYGVAWNGSIWVATGWDLTDNNTIKYSTDGITWSNSLGTGFTTEGYGVGYSSNVIPAYNQTNFEIESQNIPNFLRSTNQLSFLPSTIIANNTLFVDTTNRVGINTGNPQTDLDVYGIGRFLTASTLALNVSSINGANFPRILPSTIDGLGTVGYLSTLAFPSTVSTSYALTFGTSSMTMSSINFVNVAQSSSNLWVAQGANDTQYSTDGSNWTSAASGFSTGYGAAWNGTLWVGVGNQTSGSIRYSADANTWTNATSGTFALVGYGVAWNGSYWVAVGDNNNTALGSIRYSLDGKIWTPNATGGFAVRGRRVAWNGRLWVAVGEESPGGTIANTIQYSLNGRTWSVSASGGFGGNKYARDVAWNGRIWIAVGSKTSVTTDTIQYSTDGMNWTTVTSGGFSVAGLGIAWNGRMWVAVGEDATIANTIQYSYDGLNWFNSASGGFGGNKQGNSVAWNGRLWIAVGSRTAADTDTIQYSIDGINWTASSSGGFGTSGNGIAYSSNLIPSYNQTNFEIEPQNIPNFLTSTNQLSFLPSTIIANNTLFIDTTNRVGINTGSPQFDLDVAGTGRFQIVSTQWLLASTVTAPTVSTQWLLASTVTAPTVSTLSLFASAVTALSVSSLQIQASTMNAPIVSTFQANVSSLTFGSGVGWIAAGAIQAVMISTTQQNTSVSYVSTLYCGSTGVNFLPGYTAYVNGNLRTNKAIIGNPFPRTRDPAYDLEMVYDSAAKPTTNTWTTTSDMRLKDNIVDADMDICYSNIKAAKLRRFTWNSSFTQEARVRDKHVLGFIAQEISTLVPKAVETKEAYGYSNLHFLNIDQLNMSLYGSVKKIITDKEQLESTVKGQRIEIQTLTDTTSYIVSTLKGLQNQ